MQNELQTTAKDVECGQQKHYQQGRISKDYQMCLKWTVGKANLRLLIEKAFAVSLGDWSNCRGSSYLAN